MLYLEGMGLCKYRGGKGPCPYGDWASRAVKPDPFWNWYWNVPSRDVSQYRCISVGAGMVFMKREFTFGGHTTPWIKSRGRLIINRYLAFGGHSIRWINSNFFRAPWLGFTSQLCHLTPVSPTVRWKNSNVELLWGLNELVSDYDSV